MIKPPKIQNRVSSGGVIYRETDETIEVAVISVRGRSLWCLPKGLIDKGETPPVAAVREVREETGLTGEILEKIGMISYWYFIKDEMMKVHKTVHFYLLRYSKGNTDDHDHEVDESRWFPIDKAVEVLAHRSEKEIVQKAKALISKQKKEENKN